MLSCCRVRIPLVIPQRIAGHGSSLLSRSIATTSPVLARKKPEVPQISKKKLAAKERRRERKVAIKLKNRYSDSTLPLSEAVRVLRALEVARPEATYELVIKTNIGRGAVIPRGRINLPVATKTAAKSDQIVVFAESRIAAAAKTAGADFAGGSELIEDIIEGKIRPTLVLATPGMVKGVAARLGRILGPKGLMPAERRGTVVDDPGAYIRTLKGSAQWGGDKSGTVRSAIGKTTFTDDDVIKNVKHFVDTVQKSIKKPDAGSGGKPSVSIARVLLSSQQGPSITLADVV
ncbi:hypothetical protein M422DRAFT_226837 [Sphaerobolus stellatus SS14]|uniref:Ribosomal protein n=1 Tax=Sphaerobolus stellatus (strain SS14) TaxID=990650 RepID=A0A0C9UU17_SPHS4|nr:hypothetical protein M422DRAFT_226837 [Sphaerobolus stellatus SS14]